MSTHSPPLGNDTANSSTSNKSATPQGMTENLPIDRVRAVDNEGIASANAYMEADAGRHAQGQDRDIVMTSREITPSSPSISASGSASSPRSVSVSASGSGSTSGIGLGESSQSTIGSNADDHAPGVGMDVDRFLKKVEMEKRMLALQQRLELASIKASNGWTDMSIKEIENRLPPTPLRTRKSSLHPASPIATSPTRSSALPYEPPSPSRPWQLIDVLWQPLPPPSHGRYPPSPSSPKKRSRTDDHDLHSRLSVNGAGYPLSPHRHGQIQKRTPATVAGSSGIHRRASSSISTNLERAINMHGNNSSRAGPSSPLRYGFEDRDIVPKKKRSQSHSHAHHSYRRQTPTTSQDVDAAKALTHMLSSGGLSDDDVHLSGSSRRQSGLSAPLLPAMGSQSLPIPEAFQRNGSTSPSLLPLKLQPASAGTPRLGGVSEDLRTPSSHTRHQIPDSGSSTTTLEQRDRGEEDKNAAELMMFLAHSPSPMKRVNTDERSDTKLNSETNTNAKPSFGMAARVLFADSDTPPSMEQVAPVQRKEGSGFAHSNLVLAPPITPNTSNDAGA
ncbi:uncharacterized protein I303_102701 [Kwoniella dejecticola CBS 10117]|uniref:Uncharacterized protein n=1 Tax=Kwoniella dejecticola CBS 10117 TaxID=1296121 RepID=A0A1A6A9H4_9TREE|nr:uncharacterized protein I303_02716 [Kwoniella dejecticola CBS 10117]OBR86704.1 hypothetical protein I303_02716 [Kwoniella dejecticola CBS 10117]